MTLTMSADFNRRGIRRGLWHSYEVLRLPTDLVGAASAATTKNGTKEQSVGRNLEVSLRRTEWQTGVAHRSRVFTLKRPIRKAPEQRQRRQRFPSARCACPNRPEGLLPAAPK